MTLVRQLSDTYFRYDDHRREAKGRLVQSMRHGAFAASLYLHAGKSAAHEPYFTVKLEHRIENQWCDLFDLEFHQMREVSALLDRIMVLVQSGDAVPDGPTVHGLLEAKFVQTTVETTQSHVAPSIPQRPKRRKRGR